MAFLESPRFPDHISIDAQGGPGMRTDVIVVNSGAEFRQQNWEQTRHRYEVSQAAKLPEQYEPLKKFFLAVGGRATGFRFKDWMDYKVAAGTGFFSPIDTTHFQLVKRYQAGGALHDRLITKPVNNGTFAIAGGTFLSLDYATGIVTMTSGTPTSWGGEFDVPCRFDVDEMIGHIVGKNVSKGLIVNWDSIPILEVRDIA